MTSPSLTARPCLELVIYKIKNPADAAKARRAAQEAISRYDGFLSWAAWEGEDDPHLFADIAMWESLEAARAAGERVRTDPDFAGLMSSIDGLISMSHYRLDRTLVAERSMARPALKAAG